MKKLEIESIDKLLLSHLLTTEPFPPHLHIHNNAYELMMFKAGNADYFINNITYRLTPGDLLLVCPNDIHGLSVKDHEPCERFPIHFNEAFIQTFSTPNTNILTCFQNHEHNHILHLSEDQTREYEYLVTQTIEALNRKEFGYDIYAKANLSLTFCLPTRLLSQSLYVWQISPLRQSRMPSSMLIRICPIRYPSRTLPIT